MGVLHPKYWGVWLAFALILPLIFLPLRWQFWIGKRLGILVHYLAKSRVQDTLTNLQLTFPNQPKSKHKATARQVFINQGIGIFESLCAWFRPNVFKRTFSISGLQHLIDAQNKIKR